MKVSLYASILALLMCGNGLIAMESVIQPKTYTWQYVNNTFKFKCVDSTSDEDVIEVPGTLVHYAKSLRAMIDDLGEPKIVDALYQALEKPLLQLKLNGYLGQETREPT